MGDIIVIQRVPRFVSLWLVGERDVNNYAMCNKTAEEVYSVAVGGGERVCQ